MKLQKGILPLFLVLATCQAGLAYSASQIPAFPGAEGFGAYSVGGRGGRVIKVTNLNDSGPGSFREAVRASGPRIVVFDVSGIINLESEIMIKNPYLTIAGQTSPGGILVTGYTTRLNTHDVIIQHMRFRVGSHRVTDGSNADPETLDAFNIWGHTIPGGGNDAYNIIIDHSSFSWGIDENFSLSYAARDTTIQWSIISEALTNAGHPKGNHSKGLLSSGKFGGVNNISIHHNYFAHNADRNPRAGGPGQGLTDIRNNVIYNWSKGGGIVVGSNSAANIVHNYSKHGPNTTLKSGIVDINYWDGPANWNNFIYLEGNISPYRQSQDDPQWAIADGGGPSILTTDYQRLTPWPSADVTTRTSSLSFAQCVLTGVGATAPVRDSVDSANIAHFSTSSGNHVGNVKYPDDYPTFQNITPASDSDNDGMADSWEQTMGLDTKVNDSSGDLDGDGYTNIEEYLHHLSVESFTYNTKCMPVPRPISK